jgi:mannose-6-phosphate isomerase-like protein (cupin superfamily)
MTTKVRQQQADLHAGSVQVVRRRERKQDDLAGGRGRQMPLFGPPDGSALDVHLIELDPGGPPGRFHLHSSSENIYVMLAGSISLHHQDGIVRLSAGDAVRFPPGVPHSAVVVGKRRAILLEIYFPAPADFMLVDEPAHSSSRS